MQVNSPLTAMSRLMHLDFSHLLESSWKSFQTAQTTKLYRRAAAAKDCRFSLPSPPPPSFCSILGDKLTSSSIRRCTAPGPWRLWPLCIGSGISFNEKSVVAQFGLAGHRWAFVVGDDGFSLDMGNALLFGIYTLYTQSNLCSCVCVWSVMHTCISGCTYSIYSVCSKHFTRNPAVCQLKSVPWLITPAVATNAPPPPASLRPWGHFPIFLQIIFLSRSIWTYRRKERRSPEVQWRSVSVCVWISP